MVYETIKQKYSENKSVKFKLYSLEYMIEEIDNKVVIYAILYPSRKLTYNTLEEAFDNFEVYNISLMNSLDRIQII
ncbi:MAG: hypothetical protein IJI22_05625 [Bacilli bacterium]|nr:hypothetical protein [Bacilli bacterium]